MFVDPLKETKPMDRIPNHKIDRSRTVEEAARLKDISDRAKAARPVDTARDRLHMSEYLRDIL